VSVARVRPAAAARHEARQAATCGDAHAVRAQVAQPQDALAVGDHGDGHLPAACGGATVTCTAGRERRRPHGCLWVPRAALGRGRAPNMSARRRTPSDTRHTSSLGQCCSSVRGSSSGVTYRPRGRGTRLPQVRHASAMVGVYTSGSTSSRFDCSSAMKAVRFVSLSATSSLQRGGSASTARCAHVVVWRSPARGVSARNNSPPPPHTHTPSAPVLLQVCAAARQGRLRPQHLNRHVHRARRDQARELLPCCTCRRTALVDCRVPSSCCC
jgi:hypothetical protein